MAWVKIRMKIAGLFSGEYPGIIRAPGQQDDSNQTKDQGALFAGLWRPWFGA
jgi:hypothetical protein